MSEVHFDEFTNRALWALETRGELYGGFLDDSFAWCLDRAVESVLTRHAGSKSYLGSFRTFRFEAQPPRLCCLIDTSDPASAFDAFRRRIGFSRIRARLGERSDDPLRLRIKRFTNLSRQLAANECLRTCLEEGRDVPDEPFASSPERRRKNRRIDTGCIIKASVVDWFEKNEPELFSAALERARRKCYRALAPDCEGVAFEVIGVLPLRQDDPVFDAYDPPLLPIAGGVANYDARNLPMSEVLSAFGYDEPVPYGLDVLIRKDGKVHVDMTGEFMSSKYADADFAYVVVEAAKSGYEPKNACDWDAGEEYVARLASAMRAGIPFEDLVAGEGRPRTLIYQ